mmetsp:Transcript_775/g.1884  ORF Transcript_775/g.1884 Transcript_775/m.1884 type:complete len:88 (-) Transcript_775:22-285(-)
MAQVSLTIRRLIINVLSKVDRIVVKKEKKNNSNRVLCFHGNAIDLNAERKMQAIFVPRINSLKFFTECKIQTQFVSSSEKRDNWCIT